MEVAAGVEVEAGVTIFACMCVSCSMGAYPGCASFVRGSFPVGVDSVFGFAFSFDFRVSGWFFVSFGWFP